MQRKRELVAVISVVMNILMTVFLQIYSVVHGIIRVKLLGMDKGRLMSVNHMLISMGFAVKAEEFYMSKVGIFPCLVMILVFAFT